MDLPITDSMIAEDLEILSRVTESILADPEDLPKIPNYILNPHTLPHQIHGLGQFQNYTPWSLKVVCLDGMMPTRNSIKTAGLDLRTPTENTVPAGGHVMIDTSVCIALPMGHYGKIEGRSGLGIKYNIVPFGGIIDEDYRGPISVKLFNFGEEDYLFKKGDKIAQLLIQPYISLVPDRVETLGIGIPRSGGFSSTGL